MLAADHRRQKQLTEALKLIKRLQTQMAEFKRYLLSITGSIPASMALGIIFSCDLKMMAPKRRTTRLNLETTPAGIAATTTTSVTNAQLQAMINQGITAALATCDTNMNGVDSHNSRT
ncbi:hypothetical protein Tco_1453530, partial [Tanacetum coccineum]